MDGKTPRKSLPRRLARAFVVLMVLGVVAVGVLPWVLGTPPARNAIVAAANRAVAPSKIGVRGLSLSWFGSLRLTGLTLTNGEGKTLINAKSAVLDRGLVALIRDHSKLGTLTLDGAAIDIERRANGSIDLVDALMPPKVVHGPPPLPEAAPKASGPATDVTLRIVRGTLKLATPELSAPLTAGQFDMDVRVPSAAGEKLGWKIRLAQPAGGTAAETLGIDGEFDHRAAGAPDLSLTVVGAHWPIAGSASGTHVQGTLNGSLKASRAAGKWATTGDAKLLDLGVSGPALAGDKLAFDALSGVWDLDNAGGAWTVRKLGVVSPVGTLSAVGSVAAGGSAVPDARLEGVIDLAALSKQVPHTLRLKEGLTLEHGSARVLVQVKTEGDVQKATVEANVSDLVARDPSRTFTLSDPAAVSAHASRTGEKVSVETLSVKTAFLDVTGSGNLDKGVKLSGTVDLGKFQTQFRDLIDFGTVQLAGTGRMAGDYKRTGPTFVGRYAADLRGLKVVGLSTEPFLRDAVRFDLSANGPAEASGVPKTWENVRLNLKSSRDSVAVAATQRDGVVSMTVAGSVPVPPEVSSRDGQADVKLIGRWKPSQGQGKLEFDELRLLLRPTDPALVGGTFVFAARGWLDLDADDLVMNPLPLPAGAVEAVAVAPEGLKVHGLRNTPTGGKAAKIGLVGDLSALERVLLVWMGRPPSGLGGAFAAQLGAGPGDAGKLNLSLTATVPAFTRAAADGKGLTQEGTVSLAYRGAYDPAADRLTIDALVAGTRYGRFEAAGKLDAPAGRRLADLQGTIAPNWETVSTIATQSVGSATRLQGKPRAFRVTGPLSGDSLAAMLKGLDAELGVELVSADAFGLRLGATAVVVKGKGGAFTVDPIDTTLNNGRVILKPGLTVDEVQGIAVQFAQGSAIEGAEINDEVSKEVLCYVAPVLDEATHVNGKVSMKIEQADIPITGPDTRKTNMTGELTFQDVVFAPGPFATQMLTLVGRPNEPGLRLQQPVQLSVLDGRVNQKGLEIPIRGDAKVALEGSVGFDETLNLVATVPITKGMLGSRSGLDQLVGAGNVKVPIKGTVKRPQIDRRALQVALRDLTKNVLKKELSKEGSGLLDKLGPPPAAGAQGGSNAGSGDIEDQLKGLGGQLLKRVAPGGGKP